MPTPAVSFPQGQPRRRAGGTLLVLLAVLLASSLLPSVASAARSVSFVSGFSPGGVLGLGLSYSTELTFGGSEYHGHVDPLTGLTVHLPAGTGTSSAGFPTCSKATLEGSGSSACLAGSLAGPVGSVTALFPLGGETLEDQGTAQAVFGPSATLYVVLEAAAPVSLKLVMEGHYVSDSAPYGQDLVLSMPTIETVPGSGDMSIAALTLHIGTAREEGGVTHESISYPSSCRSGKFAWAADAAFNGGAAERVGATETLCSDSEVPADEEPPVSTTTPVTTSSTAPSGSGSSTPVAKISTAQIVASLAHQLVPSGKAAKIPELLRHGGLSMGFTALEAGTLTVRWYVLPSRAKVGKQTKAKPVLLASGQASFAGAGTGKVKIGLTTQGRNLLKHGKQLTTVKGTFAPKAGGAVSLTKELALRRQS